MLIVAITTHHHQHGADDRTAPRELQSLERAAEHVVAALILAHREELIHAHEPERGEHCQVAERVDQEADAIAGDGDQTARDGRADDA